MKSANLPLLRLITLFFLLPGLGGLVLSAVMSTHYLDTLPKSPAPTELRMTPRNINGTVVYQTEQEARRLTVMEYSSVGIFAIGLILSAVYLEKWGSVRSRELEEEDMTPANTN